MQNKTFDKFVIICTLLVIVGCSTVESANNTDTPVADIVTTTPVPVVTPKSVDTPFPESTRQATAMSPITAIPTSPPTVVLRDNCPTPLDNKHPSLWAIGSILFESEGTVWAISANDLTPQALPIEIGEGNFDYYIENGASNIFMSDFFRKDGDFYIVYNLATQSQIEIPTESPDPPIPIDGQYITWLPDNRAKFLINLERTEGIGETRTFHIIDFDTGQLDTFIEELDLPGYAFYDEAIHYGVASVDPNNEVVLYTVWSEPSASGFILVLRQLESGNLLWEQESPFWANLPIPDVHWDMDGDSALFSSELNGFSQPFGFLSLRSNGEIEKLPPQPFPLTDQWQGINDISRSPESRFIYYHLGTFPGQGFETGPGIIVDTSTLQAGMLCEANKGTSSEFYGGKWISENLFLYRVKTSDGYMSLRLLDASTWETQILTDIVAREFYDNAYGWTPVDLP